MAEIFQLVYVSEAAEDISYTDINDILETARKYNATENITGLLIFRDGYFLQLLEGDENIVRALVVKIIQDDRNYALNVLVEQPRSSRIFHDWSMAFHDADISSDTSKMLDDLFAVCLGPAPKDSRDFILSILDKFKASSSAFK